MKIAITFRPPLRLWQVRLALALRANGHDVILARDARKRSPSIAELAIRLQGRIFGPRTSLFDRMAPNDDFRSVVVDADQPDVRSSDLVIALDGTQTGATRQVEPTFDGKRGDAALLDMIASDKSPCVHLSVTGTAGSSLIVAATLAIEDRDTLSCAVDQVLARLVSLIVQSVRRLETSRESIEAPKPISAPGKPLRHMARGLARKIGGRLLRGRQRPPHWRIGYRWSDREDGGTEKRTWPTVPYSIIPDDGSGFYADPIPFSHAGQHYVFIEDYPYATGKGVIAVIEFGADGSPSPPCTVLERPCHLSYPFLIRHGGEVYMLPETSGDRCVQLFRAASFPDRWVADRILIDGVVAADATIVIHDDRWWMFATLSDDGGSSWDQLGLFHAPDLFGPWTPHVDNPVLVDAGAARPAGAMWHEDGVLMRVAQDCRKGYGDGLAICRVDRVDDAGYVQTVVARLSPPDGTGAAGVHTLGRDGDLEVIDLRFSSACR